MSRAAPASDRGPMLSSGVHLSEPYTTSHLQNKVEETTTEVHHASQLSTFPTDQVPQPVKRVRISNIFVVQTQLDSP